MKTFPVFLIVIILEFYFTFTFAQQDQSSLNKLTEKRQDEQKGLPQIQMEEYTIMGLAKITLPEKIRTQIFKEVKIGWSMNKHILAKEKSVFAFSFSRVKPSILRLPNFPKFDSNFYYGSFNEFGLNLKTQLNLPTIQSYLSGAYVQSDGHTENAQWYKLRLKTGFHQQISETHLLHAGISYDMIETGIWKNWEYFQNEWDIQTNLISFFANLDQRWSSTLSTELSGNYYYDKHKNAADYRDKGFDLFGNLRITFNNTALLATVEYQNKKINLKPGNINDLNFLFSEFNEALLNGLFVLQQELGPLTVKVGGLFQQTKEPFDTGQTIDTTYLNPYGALVLRLSSSASLSVVYHPEAKLFRLNNMVRELPNSDIVESRIVNYYSLLEPTFFIQIPTNLRLDLSGSIAKIKHYSAPIFGGDLVPDFTPPYFPNFLFYPGWKYGVIDEIELNEFKSKLDWQVIPQLNLLAGFNYRDARIKHYKNSIEHANGNKIPYLPEIIANGSVRIKPFKINEVQISGEYIGKRYDDVSNADQIDAFFLLNTRVEIGFHHSFRIFGMVRNILDKKYERWRGFEAPGITYIAGIRLAY